MRPLLECLQFLAYEHMKRGLAALQPLDPHQKRPQKLLISDLTLAATASKVVATMFTYPYQVVRSCMQQRRAVGGDMVRSSLAWTPFGVASARNAHECVRVEAADDLNMFLVFCRCILRPSPRRPRTCGGARDYELFIAAWCALLDVFVKMY
uniref:Uncharacterized protein n=1 Tax=Chrysotila carterae TaxID=13221 RepID=A0A7S4B892_CHRCT